MRIMTIGRLLALLLLLGGTLAVPIFDVPISTVTADEGKDESGNNEKDDKDKDKDGDQGGGNGGAAITASEGYEVQVECAYDDTADTSTCTFTGVAPEGDSDVSHIDLPEEAVCAEVVGGDHEYVNPDPNTRVVGYKSHGSEGTFTLELQGEVTAGGTTTYWFKTGDGVFPATGPGLVCGEEAAAAFELQTTPGSGKTVPQATATPTSETGELLVLVYSCTDVPEDKTGFDWFGTCDPEGGVHQFELSAVSEVAVEPQTAESDESGDLTVGDLEPGLYSLKITDVSWCHAVSDNVDAEGNVTIEAGQRTTVWGFVCEDDTVK